MHEFRLPKEVQLTMSPSKYNWENAFSKISADSAMDASAIMLLCDVLERGVAITDVDNLDIKMKCVHIHIM